MTTRQAFTLIELMIVIAIIAIIASIAIPNLLESRLSGQEAAAGASLRSGLVSAEIQFQGGDYCDLDKNGVGTYAVDGIQGASGAINPYAALSGYVTVASSVTCQMLPANWGTSTAYVSASATGTSASTAGLMWPIISGYQFKTPITCTAPSGTSDGSGERVWGAISFPSDDNEGRHFFMVSQGGVVYMSKAYTNCFSSATVYQGGVVTVVTASSAFGALMTSSPSSTYFSTFHH
jgi:prepilin-type N-terminal cleavage/methylation domain-containing protein